MAEKRIVCFLSKTVNICRFQAIFWFKSTIICIWRDILAYLHNSWFSSIIWSSVALSEHISNFAGTFHFRRYIYACSIYYRLGPLCVKGLVQNHLISMCTFCIILHFNFSCEDIYEVCSLSSWTAPLFLYLHINFNKYYSILKLHVCTF